MEVFTNEQVSEAKRIGDFYIDLLDNHKESLVYYLSETAVLDWFGHTVKGSKNISSFVRHNIQHHQQHFNSAQPVEKIGYRDTHVIKLPNKSVEICDNKIVPSTHTDNEVTPPKRNVPIISSYVEQGQGDGPQNIEIPESPVKKCKLDHKGEGDGIKYPSQIKYISTKGHIEFRKNSLKKLQAETKWNRPCKLEIAYSGETGENCTIYMIIYQNNMKCKKNLLREFESCENKD